MSRALTILACCLLSATLCGVAVYVPDDPASTGQALIALAGSIAAAALLLVAAAALDPEERRRRVADQYRAASLCRRLELPDEQRKVVSFAARSVR